MKCISCGHDSKYKERTNQICPQCKKRFAFEPRAGAKLTDQAFQNAIDRVSGGGKVRWGAEHLYYELARRLRPRLWLRTRASRIGAAIVAVVVLAITYMMGIGFMLGAIVLGGALATTEILRARKRTIGLDRTTFSGMLIAWERAHGTPAGLIQRPAQAVAKRPSRSLEYEMVDYSFDRAVICDRARTVDLLLANNFHFENNCAVLSIEGYPPGPFETVRIMLKRNPKLQVFALHDATVDGCTLAHRLSTDPAWFAGQVPVVDVGLRPGHAAPFRGLWLPAPVLAGVGTSVAIGNGIKAEEAAWLQQYNLELAAIRPDQVLKRLFRAMNRRTNSDSDSGSDDDGLGLVYITDGPTHRQDNDNQDLTSFVIEDPDSFGSDASADDGGADSFG